MRIRRWAVFGIGRSSLHAVRNGKRWLLAHGIDVAIDITKAFRFIRQLEEAACVFTAEFAIRPDL
jgi:hypothetical protein